MLTTIVARTHWRTYMKMKLQWETDKLKSTHGFLQSSSDPTEKLTKEMTHDLEVISTKFHHSEKMVLRRIFRTTPWSTQEWERSNVLLSAR